MRQIRRSRKFKRDYKKAVISQKDSTRLKDIINKIANAEKLDRQFDDYSLSGNWKGYRELHLKPDLLLIYKITGDELRLARLGSHSELF